MSQWGELAAQLGVIIFDSTNGEVGTGPPVGHIGDFPIF